MNKFMLAIAMTLFLASAAHAKIIGKAVTYEANGMTMKGFIAYDSAKKGKRPGVIVVHEWWGQNSYARKRARMLAKLGYTAMAIDMYGNGKVVDNPTDAGKLSGAVFKDMATAKARFEAGMRTLMHHRTVDQSRIAAYGYCFGGGIALAMAREGEDLKGVASFHGSLGTATPAQPGQIKARIISFSGEADPFIPADKVAAFKQEMDSAGVNYQVVTYPGALHAFTNPAASKVGMRFNIPIAYDKNADKDSWKKGTEFLKEVFGKK